MLAAQSWAGGTVGAAARGEARFGLRLLEDHIDVPLADSHMALRESKPIGLRTSARWHELLGAREAEAAALASCTHAGILLGPGGQLVS
jgi:hypothetical protein